MARYDDDDEDHIDMRPLLRITAWGACAAIALGAAVMSGRTEVGAARAGAAFAALETAPKTIVAHPSNLLASGPSEADKKALELAETVRSLTADRDRLAEKVATLERSLDDLTGSIARDASARAANAAASPPSAASAEDRADSPAPAAASPAAAAAPASPPAPAQIPPAQVASAQVAPAQVAPAQVTPAQVTPAQAGPAQVASAQVASAQVAPAQVTPAQVTPAQVASASPNDTPPTPAPVTQPGVGQPANVPLPRPGPLATIQSYVSSTSGMSARPGARPSYVSVGSAQSYVNPAAGPAAAPAAAETKLAEAPATADANPPAPAAAPNKFAVDLASATNVNALRARWGSIKTSHGALVGGLRPLVSVRESTRPGFTEFHLVAGPIADLDSADRLCGALSSVHVACRPATYDGQRLDLR
jgi:hypothetical protein